MEDDESFEELEEESTDDPAAFEAAKLTIVKRCDAAKIPHDTIAWGENEPLWLTVYLPAGRTKRSVYLSDAQEAENFLSLRFEDFTFLGDYTAICSYKEGKIEALIRGLGPSNIPRNLFGVRTESPEDEIDQSEVTFAVSNDTVSVGIGPVSNEFQHLTGRGRLKQFSLSITGLRIAQHDQSLAILEKVANSLFFQIEVKIGLPLGLARERTGLKPRGSNLPRHKATDLEFPRFSYNNEPISLYWYARSARAMPLLQFLAYYQCVEFFFPIYSQTEAGRRVRNILKDPNFSAQRDTDIARLLASIKLASGRGFGDERSQLRATIQECIQPDALRSCLISSGERKEYYISKSKALSPHKLPIQNPEADLRNDVADRIYDIRCKIVHTKTASGEGEVELLLPFSQEADLLYYEIDLLQYIARQVLIASSAPLTI
jgi:hypothetical protein